jgi:hypothetical protein
MTEVWALTTYFNPMRYSSRLTNYRVFRQHLGLPLITVEGCYGGRAELTAEDAEVLIKVDYEHLLWQKERLINHAINLLPKSVTILAWLDCDVVFDDPNWFVRLQRVLADAPVAQCYSTLLDLPASNGYAAPTPATIRRAEQSIAAFVLDPNAFGVSDAEAKEMLHGTALGGAWAGRRDFLESCGLFDRMILGGGDRAFAYACFGHFDDAIRIARMTPRLAQDYRRWATGVFETVQGRVGLIEGKLLHLWHGAMADRQYLARHELLSNADFDPGAHIRVARSGAWEWSANAPETLRHIVTRYFQNRREDGHDASPEGAR